MRSLRTMGALLVVMFCVLSANADWVKQNTNTFAWFKDIYFLNESKGWIVGSDGMLLSTIDGGLTWKQTKRFTNDGFVQVHFENEWTGWLLCERNIYARGANASSYLRKTTDGGRTWEKIEFQDGGRQRITKLLFNGEGNAIAFGEGGVFYKLQEDGVSWKKTETAIHYLLLDADYSNDLIGAIVGAGGTILFTRDGGLTWEKATLLSDTETRFNAIRFFGRDSAWAVGSRGRIFRSNGNARLWRQQNSTVTADLNDVYFTSPNSGWAVGEHGVIVRTRDGGKTWYNVPSRTTHRLEKLAFAGGRGFAVGFGGTVLTYVEDSRFGEPGIKPVLQKRN